MTPIARLRDAAYQAQQRVAAGWLCRRHRRELDRVRHFLLFVGYPRSGHSVVGALLNAHRDAVVSHQLDAPSLVLGGCSREQLYGRILARAQWFHWRGDTSNYRYRVPGQWQGRFASLRVIGDKRGGIVTRSLAANPDLLDRVRALAQVPLRLIHVVRNPFDNIAAISIWHRMSLAASVDYYFEHWRTTSTLADVTNRGELITIRHEDMLRDPRAALGSLCTFLDLDPYPGYLEDCASLVFEAPTRTRHRIEWTAATVEEVRQRARAHRLLDGYDFDGD